MKSLFISLLLALFVSGEQDVSSSLQNLAKNITNPLKDVDINKVVGMAKNFRELDMSSELEELAAKLDPAHLPVINEGEEILKERCLRNGHNQSYEEVQVARDELQNCLAGLINIEEMQVEINEAKPTGDLDEVFKKYCKRTPKLKQCIQNFTSTIENCLGPNEHEAKETMLNVTDSIIKFVCFKEGDRIALFIAEGGPDCILNNFGKILDCVNTTVGKYRDQHNITEPSADDEFVIEPAHCDGMSEIQECVVRELESCQEPTPANIVDSMFKFVRKSTPCYTYDKLATGSSGKNSATLSVIVLIAGALLLSREW